MEIDKKTLIIIGLIAAGGIVVYMMLPSKKNDGFFSGLLKGGDVRNMIHVY